MSRANRIRREIVLTTLARCCEISRHLLLGSRTEDVSELVADAVEGAFVTREEWPRG